MKTQKIVKFSSNEMPSNEQREIKGGSKAANSSCQNSPDRYSCCDALASATCQGVTYYDDCYRNYMLYCGAY